MPPPSIGWSYVRPAGSKLQACDSTSWQPDLISYLVLHHHGTPSAARDQQPGESADQPLPVARPQGLRSNPKPASVRKTGPRNRPSGFHRNRLGQARATWPVGLPSVLVDVPCPFTAAAASTLSAGSGPTGLVRLGSPDPVGTPSGSGIMPVSGQLCGTAGGGPAVASRVPAALRRAGLGSGVIC